MRRLICLMLLLLVAAAPLAHAYTEADLNEVLEIVNGIQTDTVGVTARYDAEAKAVCAVLKYKEDYEILTKAMELDSAMADAWGQLVAGFNAMLRSSLDDINAQELAAVTIVLTQDKVPLSMSVNGVDASWMLN